MKNNRVAMNSTAASETMTMPTMAPVPRRFGEGVGEGGGGLVVGGGKGEVVVGGKVVDELVVVIVVVLEVDPARAGSALVGSRKSVIPVLNSHCIKYEDVVAEGSASRISVIHVE
jgi:hypothetical protein